MQISNLRNYLQTKRDHLQHKYHLPTNFRAVVNILERNYGYTKEEAANLIDRVVAR